MSRPKPKLRLIAPVPVPRFGGPRALGSALSAAPDVFPREMNREKGEEIESDGVPLRAWVPNFLSRIFF